MFYKLKSSNVLKELTYNSLFFGHLYVCPLENTYFSQYSRLFSCRVLAFKHIFQLFTSIYMFFLSEDKDSFYKLTYILDFYSYLYVNLSNLDSFYYA